MKPVVVFSICLAAYAYSALALLGNCMPWPIMLVMLLASVAGMVGSVVTNSIVRSELILPLQPADLTHEREKHGKIMSRVLLGLALLEVAGLVASKGL